MTREQLMEGIDELLRGVFHGYLKRGQELTLHPEMTLGPSAGWARRR
jgi:hypothetical protein